MLKISVFTLLALVFSLPVAAQTNNTHITCETPGIDSSTQKPLGLVFEFYAEGHPTDMDGEWHFAHWGGRLYLGSSESPVDSAFMACQIN